MLDKGPAPRTAHALRAGLLFRRSRRAPSRDQGMRRADEETDEDIEALSRPPDLDRSMAPPAWYTEEAEALANHMLERLRSWVVKP